MFPHSKKNWKTWIYFSPRRLLLRNMGICCIEHPWKRFLYVFCPWVLASVNWCPKHVPELPVNFGDLWHMDCVSLIFGLFVFVICLPNIFIDNRHFFWHLWIRLRLNMGVYIGMRWDAKENQFGLVSLNGTVIKGVHLLGWKPQWVIRPLIQFVSMFPIASSLVPVQPSDLSNGP